MASCKYCGSWFADGTGYKKNYCCEACYENSDEKRRSVFQTNLLYNDDSFSGVVARSVWFAVSWFCLFALTGVVSLVVTDWELNFFVFIGVLYGISLFQSILIVHKKRWLRKIIVLGIPVLIILLVYGIELSIIKI